MAPWLHRQVFFAPMGENPTYVDAEENVDCDLLADDRSDFWDQRYAQAPTAEPLSEGMMRLVRSQLATLFYERMAIGIRCTLNFKVEWYHMCGTTHDPRSFDQPRLPPGIFVPRSRTVREHLLEYADVHVAVYLPNYRTRQFGPCVLGRYIWGKWFSWHDGRPPFLGYQRFSKPITLKGTRLRDVQNILGLHRSLCDAVSIGLSQRELPRRSPSMHRSSHIRLKPRRMNLRTYKDRGREMAYLFRAIVIIVDDQVMQYKEPEFCCPVPAPGSPKASACNRSWVASQNSVLLLRTGDDAHLSSPISFQSLYDSGKALPVNRPDCDDDGMTAVRVKIDAALEFVFDLIHREQEAIPAIGLAAEIENRQHWEVCEQWVDGVMEHAGRVGIDKNGHTWQAVRRAKAALNGEAFDHHQTDPPWTHLTGASFVSEIDWIRPPEN